jgi:putative hydrolase of the HAD superfamily
MADEIKVVLFDLGNVLVDFDYSTAAKRIMHFCDKNPKALYDFFFGSDACLLFEEGKISPQDFFNKVKDSLGLKISYEAFVPIWNEIFFLSAKNRAVYSLANKLSLRYQVSMLSNINVLHYEYLKKSFPVFSIFHQVFASCELGLAKPNPLIYRKVLEVLQVGPEAVFYTDDRKELIECARSLGIRGFTFKGVNQLKDDLVSSGVIL